MDEKLLVWNLANSTNSRHIRKKVLGNFTVTKSLIY